MKSAWKSFLELCLTAKNPDELSKILAVFLTLEEKSAIGDRYNIIHALLENKLTQREIAETYNVSIATITRGSNALKLMDAKSKALLEKNV